MKDICCAFVLSTIILILILCVIGIDVTISKIGDVIEKLDQVQVIQFQIQDSIRESQP